MQQPEAAHDRSSYKMKDYLKGARGKTPLLGILLAAGAACSLAAVAAYIYFSQSGIDLTDEGFYLNWLEYFNEYPALTTLFAVAYKPIYLLSGKNIQALRILNILLVLAAGIYIQLRAVERPRCEKRNYLYKRDFALIAIIMGPTSLLALGSWTTPSYNHLTYIGCALICCALIPYADYKNESHYIPNSLETILLSGGLTLALLGKPSSGLALILVIIIFAATRSKSARFKIFTALGCSLISFAVLTSWTTGGATILIEKIMLGKEWIQVLDGGYNPTRLAVSIIKIILSPLLLIAPLLVSLQLRLISGWHSIDQLRRKDIAITGVSLASIAAILSLLTFFLSANGLTRLNIFSLSLVVATAITVNHSGKWQNLAACLKNKGIIPYYGAITIALIPFCYGFGTNTSIWIKALSTSSIYTALTLKMLSSSSSAVIAKWKDGIIACCILSLLLSMPGISRPIVHPYRQDQPKWTYKNLLTISPANQSIYVSESIYNYVAEAQELLNKNGFTLGNPIIDMTGQSPTLVYVLGGKAVGQAWMIGGYPGSSKLAKKAISQIKKDDLERAWIITEENGPRSLALSALTENGMDINNINQYAYVGTITAPKGAGGNDHKREQSFYRPANS
jgi:hypothetical protein